MNVRIHVTDEPAVADRKRIKDAIKEFNNHISPHHLAVRQPGAIAPLAIFVYDDRGDFVGGLTADTYWHWLDIDVLWLHESLRRQGYGRRILAMAEREAIHRGCGYAQVKTFSFQARGFYEKLGYDVVGELREYPPGASLYWLRKELVPGWDIS